MSLPLEGGRPCGLCSNPVPFDLLVEVHVGPTRRHPHADVVVWLCVACAVDVSAGPADDRKHVGGRQ